jgi:hypothetical protein
MEKTDLLVRIAGIGVLLLVPLVLGTFVRKAWQTLPLAVLLVLIAYVPANLFRVELYDSAIPKFPEQIVPRLILATVLELGLWAIAATLLALVGFGIKSLVSAAKNA